MDNLNDYQDIEEHLNKFTLFIDEYNEAQKARQVLIKIVDKLNDEIEILKKSEFNLTLQLKTITDSSEMRESINTLYVKLKENYNGLQEKHNHLLEDNILLQEKHIFEKVELQEKFMLEKNQIIEDLTKQINAFEAKNEQQKLEYLKKESELYNELQLAQAANALQSDDMESRLQTVQLQLRASNQSCKALREEYLSFTIRSNCDLDTANKRIEELSEVLQRTEQRLRITEEQLFSSTKNRNFEMNSNVNTSHTKLNYPQVRPTNVYSSKMQNMPTAKNRTTTADSSQFYNTAPSNTRSTKYDSLDVNAVTAPKNINQNPYGYQRETQYENLSVQDSTIGSNNFKKSNNPFVPALKQTSKPAQKPISKKRKLYKPGCFDYLNDKNQSN